MTDEEKYIKRTKLLLGLNMYRIRKTTGLNQTDFAASINLNRSYLNGLEKGTKNPTVRMLYRIAEELGLSAKHLVMDIPIHNFEQLLIDVKTGNQVFQPEKPMDCTKLVELRNAHHLLQGTLAKLTGLSRNHISGLERGIYHPTLVTLAKLAYVYHVDVEVFF